MPLTGTRKVHEWVQERRCWAGLHVLSSPRQVLLGWWRAKIEAHVIMEADVIMEAELLWLHRPPIWSSDGAPCLRFGDDNKTFRFNWTPQSIIYLNYTGLTLQRCPKCFHSILIDAPNYICITFILYHFISHYLLCSWFVFPFTS